MRHLIPTALLALILTACGGGDEGATERADASPPAGSWSATSEPSPTTEAAAEGESPGCLVATTKWADRMTDHVLEAATTAPGFAESLDLSDTEDPTSEATALCSEAITGPLLEGNAALAEANFELASCELAPVDDGFGGKMCPEAGAKRVRAAADRAASFVSEVRQQV